jgi:DNA-binding Lrp family transcriptional regulator
MKNALELFRSDGGKTYQQVAKALGTSEAEVERQIHRLRSDEKGDTAHDDYCRMKEASDRRARDKHRAYQLEWQREMRARAKA